MTYCTIKAYIEKIFGKFFFKISCFIYKKFLYYFKYLKGYIMKHMLMFSINVIMIVMLFYVGFTLILNPNAANWTYFAFVIAMLSMIAYGHYKNKLR